MKRIRLDFCDFWPGFCKTKNFFFELLSQRFDVELHDKPDFVIYSDFGNMHRLYSCPRIFFSGEGTSPDFTETDYAFTSDYNDHPRHLRLPLYIFYLKPEELIKGPDFAERILANERKFCSFVVSKPKNKERIAFFQRLSSRRHVDSGGRHLNNIGGPVKDKYEFLKSYRFNIAFENRSRAGYTTEKIVQAMRVGCIPIYWGNPLVAREFNPESFFNFHDFPNEEAVIQRVLEIDSNMDLYAEYLRRPWFHDNRPNEYFDKGRLLDRFEEIFSARISPVGQRRKWFQVGRWVLVKKQRAQPV